MRINLSSILTIDIETIARKDIDLIQAKSDLLVDLSKRYKTQKTIEEHLESDFADYVDKLPLDKFSNQIISISVMNDRFSEAKVFYSENEEILLREFVTFLNELFLQVNENIILHGYNLYNFDLPQIIFKLAKYNIQLDYPIFSQKKYDSLDSFDMLGAKGSLDKLLKEFGIEGKYNGYTGKDVAKLYNEGKIEELISYSKQDAVSEHLLIKRLLSVYGYK